MKVEVGIRSQGGSWNLSPNIQKVTWVTSHLKIPIYTYMRLEFSSFKKLHSWLTYGQLQTCVILWTPIFLSCLFFSRLYSCILVGKLKLFSVWLCLFTAIKTATCKGPGEIGRSSVWQDLFWCEELFLKIPCCVYTMIIQSTQTQLYVMFTWRPWFLWDQRFSFIEWFCLLYPVERIPDHTAFASVGIQ